MTPAREGFECLCRAVLQRSRVPNRQTR